VFAPVVKALLGAAALVALIGLGIYALVKPFLPQPKTDDVRPRKAWFQRVFAAGGVGVSLVAGHQLRRDTRRYLAFGALENEKFLPVVASAGREAEPVFGDSRTGGRRSRAFVSMRRRASRRPLSAKFLIEATDPQK
jgi:hypothetical protein